MLTDESNLIVNVSTQNSPKPLNKDILNYLTENYPEALSKIFSETGITLDELLPKQLENFQGSYPDKIRDMRFENFEKRRKRKLEFIVTKIKEIQNIMPHRNNSFETFSKGIRNSSIRSLSLRKEPCMERVKRARNNQLTGFVNFMRRSVEKITDKMSKSEINLKKACEMRNKELRKRGNKREERIKKILIHKHKEEKLSRKLPEIKTPSPKPKLSKSISYSKRIVEDSLNTTQSLEKIERKLKSGSFRAQEFRKHISTSVARLSSLYKPVEHLGSDLEYREKITKILQKQSKIEKSRSMITEKILKKIKTNNQKKTGKKELLYKREEKLRKLSENYSVKRFNQINQRLENLRKNKELCLLISSEK